MLATILNRNITVVSYTEPYIWSADPDKPLDISLGYFGPQQFVPAEVGKKFCYTVFTNKSLIYITYVMLIQVHLNIWLNKRKTIVAEKNAKITVPFKCGPYG